MAKAEIKLDTTSMKSAEKILNEIEELVRGPAISRTLRTVGLAVKADVVTALPKPGYPGDKPQFKPLRETMVVRVKSYGRGATKVLVVGYSWPEGAHGQPLEAGHEMWLWGKQVPGRMVDPKPYMGDVIQRTAATRGSQLVDGARKVLARVKGSG